MAADLTGTMTKEQIAQQLKDIITENVKALATARENGATVGIPGIWSYTFDEAVAKQPQEIKEALFDPIKATAMLDNNIKQKGLDAAITEIESQVGEMTPLLTAAGISAPAQVSRITALKKHLELANLIANAPVNSQAVADEPAPEASVEPSPTPLPPAPGVKLEPDTTAPSTNGTPDDIKAKYPNVTEKEYTDILNSATSAEAVTEQLKATEQANAKKAETKPETPAAESTPAANGTETRDQAIARLHKEAAEATKAAAEAAKAGANAVNNSGAGEAIKETMEDAMRNPFLTGGLVGLVLALFGVGGKGFGGVIQTTLIAGAIAFFADQIFNDKPGIGSTVNNWFNLGNNNEPQQGTNPTNLANANTQQAGQAVGG